MLDTIREIVLNLKRKRLKRFHVFNPMSPTSGMEKDRNYDLFDAIRNNKVTGNKEAAKFLGYEDPSDKAFIMAMGRFRDSLLNLFFFIEEKSVFPNDYLKAQAKALRYLMMGRLLFISGLPLVALKLLQKAILLADKFQIADLLEEAMLRYIIAGVRIDRGTYLAKYIQQYPEVKKHADALKLVEFQTSMVYKVVTSKRRINEEGRSVLVNAVKAINDVGNVWGDIRIAELRFLANAYLFQINSEVESLVQLCAEYEAYLKTSPFARNKHFTELFRLKLIGLLHSKSFKESEMFFRKSVTYFNKDLSNYINFLEVFFLICLRFKKYTIAKEILEDASASKQYVLLPSSTRERWMIYEPFLIFALKTNYGKDYHIQTENVSYEIRIERFLKKMPIAAKDKQGLNPQILISQILLLLLERTDENENAIIDRANSLKAYNHRYFKKTGHSSLLRTYYFIQFLIRIADAAFNQKRARVKTAKVLEKLKNTPLDYLDISQNMEIIPYDHLIEMVFKNLDTES